MNSFGRNFRVSIFGESHGESVGVVLDGVPAGIPLTTSDFASDLDRRKSGAKGTTPRKESDAPHLMSGVFNDHTTGAPLTIMFNNENTLSGDYKNLVSHPRPSHADWVAQQKFDGFADYRGGGHFSARLTLGLVAAGVVAKKIINEGKPKEKQVHISSRITELGGSTYESMFPQIIDEAVRTSNSIGGVIECQAEGVAVGLGEPFFDSAESLISHLVFSIPAIKGIEFGAGFDSARKRGSENNDPITSADGTTATNNSGGINAGITNGNPIIFRVAVKPTPSISTPQQTLNTQTGTIEELCIKGRHDACVALRAPVIVEAALAIALADMTLTK